MTECMAKETMKRMLVLNVSTERPLKEAGLEDMVRGGLLTILHHLAQLQHIDTPQQSVQFPREHTWHNHSRSRKS